MTLSLLQEEWEDFPRTRPSYWWILVLPLVPGMVAPPSPYGASFPSPLETFLLKIGGVPPPSFLETIGRPFPPLFPENPSPQMNFSLSGFPLPKTLVFQKSFGLSHSWSFEHAFSRRVF